MRQILPIQDYLRLFKAKRLGGGEGYVVVPAVSDCELAILPPWAQPLDEILNQRRMKNCHLLLILFATAVSSPNPAPAQTRDLAAGPDPREIPVPPIKTPLGTMPGVNELPVRTNLPDAMVMNDGTRVTTPEQWKARREEMKRILEYYAIGAMPPAPGNVTGREMQSQTVLDGTVKYRLVHLTFGPGEKLELNIGIFTPVGEGPFPVVITPEGTPPGATPLPTLPQGVGQGHAVDALLPESIPTNSPQSAATASTNSGAPRAGRLGGGGNANAAERVAASHRDLFRRGYACVVFNNNDCAEDTTLRNADGSWAFRTTRFYPAYPDYDWGILAGWAWGVSRIVDYLETDASVDKTRLIVTGASRTGKSAMIAAAFDERLAMGAPVVTGGGGIGAYRFDGTDRVGPDGKEGLSLMEKKYPNWFSPHLHEFWGQADKLPFDEHWFLALAAPRPFIALEGLTDPVSLENAVKQSWQAARPVYRFLGATDHLGVNYANHAHAFTADDWTALMDFADQQLGHKQIARRFDQFPSDAPATPAPDATK